MVAMKASLLQTVWTWQTSSDVRPFIATRAFAMEQLGSPKKFPTPFGIFQCCWPEVVYGNHLASLDWLDSSKRSHSSAQGQNNALLFFVVVFVF